jgi:hypothetical protein
MNEILDTVEPGAGVDTYIEAGDNNPYVRAVNILNKAFDHFNEKYCEGILKRPLITILSRGRKACLGWHWKNKWDYQGSLHTEIMVAAETLRRPIQDILETLLHEMVHLWNSQHDVKDCNSSQYHNKHFKKVAENTFFLEVDRMPQRGFALTRLSVKSRDDVQNFIDQEQIGDFRLVRVSEQVSSGKAKKQYMINVSEEDFFWFKQMKDSQGSNSKEFFALLRDTYIDMYDNNQLTGT